MAVSEHTHIRFNPGPAVARAIALFFGGFGLLNVLGELCHPGFDANLWWIDLRPLAPWAARVFLVPTAVLLVAYGVTGRCGRMRRILTFVAALLLAAVAIANALSASVLASRETALVRFPLPFSLIVAALMLLVATVVALKPSRRATGSQRAGVLLGATTFALLGIGFPLAQMFSFGTTDYRRPADAAVVFGARVYADGEPSLAVADRVRTACGLYRDGLVRQIILSGGPGDGATHETEAMRRLSLRLGVRAEDIVIDEAGINTEATVCNTSAILREGKPKRVLAVSHFYHLPRIKLTYARQGLDVYTVPAHETRALAKLPWYMAREVAAFWVYYLRPLQQV